MTPLSTLAHADTPAAPDAQAQARTRLAWALLALVLVYALAGLATGTQGLSLPAFWADLQGDQAGLILGQIRAPRTLGAALVGALLGLGGALAQGLFRNPLADPYLLGSAAGAGLAVVLVLAGAALAPDWPRWAAWPSAWPPWPGWNGWGWCWQPLPAHWSAWR
jgi:iron complex transport system permease protein